MTELSEKHRRLASLGLADGGLGLGLSNQTSHVAYLASMTECAKSIQASLRSGTSMWLLDTKSIIEMKLSVEYVRSIEGQHADNNFSIEYLVGCLEDKKLSSLQHHVSSRLQAHNKSVVSELLANPNEKAWFTSLQSQEAGMWLDVSPKSSLHKMTNEQFAIALTLRMYLPQKCILPGMKCNCSGNRGKHAVIDVYGIHFCTGCSLQGVRITTHNKVRDRVGMILNYCGVFTVTEERDAFRGDDPTNGKRPDLSAFNLPKLAGKQALDIQITSPIPSGSGHDSLSESQAGKPLRAATKAFQKKQSVYQKICDNNAIGFLPIIFESTGRLHPTTEDLLKNSLQKAAEVRQVEFSRLWKFWMSSLMMLLQSSLAEGIWVRSNSIFGRKFNYTHESTERSVREFNDRRTGVATME